MGIIEYSDRINRILDPYNIQGRHDNQLINIIKPYTIRSKQQDKNNFELVNVNIASRTIEVINFTRAELQGSYDLITKLIKTTTTIINEAKTKNFDVTDLSWATKQLTEIATECHNEKYLFITDFINAFYEYYDTIKQYYDSKYKLITFLINYRNELDSLSQEHKKYGITTKSRFFLLNIVYNILTKIINFFDTYIKKNMLFKAIANKDNTKVEELLKTIDINVVKNGETALICALSHNNLEILDILIKAGVDTNVCFSNGNSVLIESIVRNKDEFANRLIEFGANIDITNTRGKSALTIALANENIGIAEKLIESGANIDITNSHGDSVLIIALIYGNLDIVKKLIEHGANINIRNKNGNSALTIAVMNGNLDIAKKLIECDADFKIKNNNGDSALTIASKKGYEDIVKMIIDTGNVTNLDRADTLLPIYSTGKKNLLKTLALQGRGDTKPRSHLNLPKFVKSQDTPLELAELYLNINVNTDDTINKKNHNGNSALIIALQANNTNIAKFIINKGADITLFNNNGDDALITALRHGHTEIAKNLINKGADITITNNSGNDALITALNHGHTEIATLLINKGADTTITNNNGDSALTIATKKGSSIIKEILEKKDSTR